MTFVNSRRHKIRVCFQKSHFSDLLNSGKKLYGLQTFFIWLFDCEFSKECNSGIKNEGYQLFFITFKSVVVDVKNGRRKSIKRSLQEYGRENVKNIYIAD